MCLPVSDVVNILYWRCFKWREWLWCAKAQCKRLICFILFGLGGEVVEGNKELKSVRKKCVMKVVASVFVGKWLCTLSARRTQASCVHR